MASSIVSLYFLELTDLFKPAKVGFQCYDRSLSMPYVETNEELIPLLMLLSLAFAAPAASVSSLLPGPRVLGSLTVPLPDLPVPGGCRSWLAKAWCTACSPGCGAVAQGAPRAASTPAAAISTPFSGGQCAL